MHRFRRSQATVVAALAALAGAVLVAAPAQAETFSSTLVKTTFTGGANASSELWRTNPSPDPSGVTYNSRTGQLILSDGEVEETNLSYHVYTGTNLFTTTLAGALVRDELQANTLAYTKEPTGVGFRPAANGLLERLFVTDDDRHRLFEVDRGKDGRYGTTDDTQTSSDVAFLSLGPENDAEDVAVDLEPTRTGQLVLVDGKGKRAFVYDPGPDKVFNGTGDTVLRTINLGPMGAGDPEGIAYHAGRNTLFVVDDPSNRLYEVSMTGALLNTVTLPFKMGSGAGIAFAPPSGGGSGVNAYIVDRGVDNDSSATAFNDGRLYELASAAFAGGAPPPPANAAPTVSAGPDLSVVLPSAASLDGTVTDDGLSGKPVTYTWTKDSGSGTVTFANASTVDTTATFSAAGTYVLRLTADDGALTASDTVTVTVTAATPNAAPTVNAGPDLAVTLPNPAALDGTVTDDGPRTALTFEWTKVNGPGTVTFGNAAAEDTTAAFSAAGTHVLQLKASDGTLSAFDEVTITVTAAPTGGIVVLDIPVRASADDAEERTSSGAVGGTSGDLNLGLDGTAAQTVGVRFTGVNVPKGATITSAHVQFTVDEASTAAASVELTGEASDNAAALINIGSGTPPFSLSARQKTTATTSWAPPSWPTVGARTADQRTPDVSAVVQAIVDRPGWASGNSLVLLATGTGTRVAESFDGGAAKAPVLHIEYTL